MNVNNDRKSSDESRVRKTLGIARLMMTKRRIPPCRFLFFFVEP